MDGRALLEAVGETYARMKSFEVEMLSTNESGDEDHLSSNSQRTRAFFAAPDKVRIEQGGAHGRVTVCDGEEVHHYFSRMKRYSGSRFEPGSSLTGSFRPEFPMMSEVFLFRQIAEKVVSAEIVREEEDARVVAVEYELLHPHFMTCSPVTFHVDGRTNLVARMEGEVKHRMPMHDETHSSKNAIAYSHAVVDQEIPGATFEYAPPADAVDASEGGVGFGGGGGGFAHQSSDGARGVESWHSSNWKGEAYVEEWKARIRGVELRFERRLSFEGDDLRIAETITGPLGITEREFSIKVSES